LPLPPDHPAAALPRPSRPLADEPPRADGLALALQRQLADRLEFEQVLREPQRRLADVGLAGRRRRLQPLREDPGVAEDGVVGARLAADNPRDPVPRVDADVQHEAARALGQLVLYPLELGVPLVRSPARA